MGMNLRHFRACAAHEFEIIVKRQAGIHAALQQNRAHAFLRRFLEFLNHLIDRISIAIRLAFVPIKRAKDAIDVANVGVIRIGVHDECNHRLGIFRAANRIRRRAQFEQFTMFEKL